MIKPDDKKIITKALGKNHLNTIDEYLRQKRVNNKNRRPFSKASICQVLAGAIENKRLETHIWKAVKFYQEQEAAREAEVNELREEIKQAVA